MANDDRSIEQLIDLLRTDRGERQKETSESLALYGASAVVPLLRVVQQEDVGTLPAYWAIDALARIGLPAVDLLLFELEVGNRPARVAAIDALGRIGDRRALEALLRTLQADDPLLRSHAATALGKLGDAQVIEPLIAQLNDPEIIVIYSVREALVALRRSAVASLIQAMEDRERGTAVRADAAAIVGTIGDEQALAPLANVVMDATEVDVVRRSAVSGLARLGSVGALEPLMDALQRRDTERSVRLSVARDLQDRRAFQQLLALVRTTDDDERVRAIVIKRLCWFGGEQAIEPLITALDDPSRQVRQAALWALAECGDLRVLPMLERARESDPALSSLTLTASVTIKRRLGLPLTVEEDPLGPAVARLGRVTLHTPKEGRSPVIEGKTAYFIRLLNDQGFVDLDKPIPLVPDDRTEVLQAIRTQLRYTRATIQRRGEQLAEAEDVIDATRIQQELARLERQFQALNVAMQELETGGDGGPDLR